MYRAQLVGTTSPIAYGYERTSFPLYFNQSPLLNVQGAQRGRLVHLRLAVDPLDDPERDLVGVEGVLVAGGGGQRAGADVQQLAFGRLIPGPARLRCEPDRRLR